VVAVNKEEAKKEEERAIVVSPPWILKSNAKLPAKVDMLRMKKALLTSLRRKKHAKPVSWVGKLAALTQVIVKEVEAAARAAAVVAAAKAAAAVVVVAVAAAAVAAVAARGIHPIRTACRT
jgi:hypothetical protein